MASNVHQALFYGSALAVVSETPGNRDAGGGGGLEEEDGDDPAPSSVPPPPDDPLPPLSRLTPVAPSPVGWCNKKPVWKRLLSVL